MNKKFIPIAVPSLNVDEKKLVLNCLKSTWISSTGKYIDFFETSFSKFINSPYAISCSNGTTALHLALLALNIGIGDEVIVPVFTFVASVNVIKYVGATPVFIDIDEKSWNLDPSQIENKITNKTKAIMVVHLYGTPADMDSIKRIAKKYDLKIIEDAAEAHMAKYKKSYVGTFGDVACFSFYGNKIITTGEGGMITTKSKQLYEKIQLLKNHGMSPTQKYYHPVVGYNYRLTNIQAAIGYAQLKKVRQFLKKRREISNYYTKYLKGIKGIVFKSEESHLQPVCWLYSVLVTKEFGLTRDTLIIELKKRGIDSRPFFLLASDFPMYATTEKFPIAKYISDHGINLPTWVNLSQKQIKYICTQIKQIQATYDKES